MRPPPLAAGLAVTINAPSVVVDEGVVLLVQAPQGDCPSLEVVAVGPVSYRTSLLERGPLEYFWLPLTPATALDTSLEMMTAIEWDPPCPEKDWNYYMCCRTKEERRCASLRTRRAGSAHCRAFVYGALYVFREMTRRETMMMCRDGERRRPRSVIER